MAEQLRQDAAVLARPGPAAAAISKATLQIRYGCTSSSKASSRRRNHQDVSNGDAILSEDGRSLLIGITGPSRP